VSYSTTYPKAAKDLPGCQNIVEIGAKGSDKERISYIDLVMLVDRIRASRTDGLEELYQLFSRGLRFYLCRQAGPQDLEDRLHDLFILIVQAIQRGEIREPERLIGFVRTVARRQASAHIHRLVHARAQECPVECESRIVDDGGTPEQAAIFREREDFIKKVLNELSDRDREILTRFYLKEQSESKICVEMVLTETQFRLLKSRAKARFGNLGKKKLVGRRLGSVPVRFAAARAGLSSSGNSEPSETLQT
jgi:RNA polymerase sigma-70 factor, ECF subfamily